MPCVRRYQTGEPIMLEQLLSLLANGPIDAKVAIHGVHQMTTIDARIEVADAVGLVLRVLDKRGNAGAPRYHPWASIMFIWPPA